MGQFRSPIFSTCQIERPKDTVSYTPTLPTLPHIPRHPHTLSIYIHFHCIYLLCSALQDMCAVWCVPCCAYCVVRAVGCVPWDACPAKHASSYYLLQLAFCFCLLPAPFIVFFCLLLTATDVLRLSRQVSRSDGIPATSRETHYSFPYGIWGPAHTVWGACPYSVGGLPIQYVGPAHTVWEVCPYSVGGLPIQCGGLPILSGGPAHAVCGACPYSVGACPYSVGAGHIV